MTAKTAAATVTTVINADRVESSRGEPVTHMLIATAVFGYSVQQKDRRPCRAGGPPSATHLDQTIAGGSVING